MTDPASISRREFGATSLRVGLGAMLAGAGLASAAPWIGRPPGSARQLRVGLVGCGGRGTGAALQALLADPDATLWAIGDAFTDKLEPCLRNVRDALSQEIDDPESVTRQINVERNRMFAGFDACEKVIATGVDVVLLTAPPGFRPRHLDACVRAGKHVFCEKPVAVDAPGVRSVMQSASIASDLGLTLVSGFCWRYHDQVAETMGKLLGGAIGKLTTVQTTYNTTGWVRPNPRREVWSDAEFMVRNWHYFHPISGDHIVEQAVHAIDWMTWALAEVPPERCWAVGGRQTRPDTPETGNVFDNFAITYEYPGGVRGYHTCRHWPNTPSDNSAYFIGTNGSCTMQPWSQRHTIDGAVPWRGEAKSNDMYQREHDLLFASIREGKPINDGKIMTTSTMLAIMGRMAAYTGQVVTWEQAMSSDEDLNAVPWTMGTREFPTLAVPGRTVLR